MQRGLIRRSELHWARPDRKSSDRYCSHRKRPQGQRADSGCRQAGDFPFMILSSNLFSQFRLYSHTRAGSTLAFEKPKSFESTGDSERQASKKGLTYMADAFKPGQYPYT